MINMILRSIYGRIITNEEWRRSNEELEDLFQAPESIAKVNSGTMRWLGDIESPSADRMPKMVFLRKLIGKTEKKDQEMV